MHAVGCSEVLLGLNGPSVVLVVYPGLSLWGREPLDLLPR